MAIKRTDLRAFTDEAQHVILHGIDQTTGAASPVSARTGKLQTVSYETAIGIGERVGHVVFRGFGRREALTTAAAGDDIWDGTSPLIPYPNQSNGEQIAFVSTSAADSESGAGVQQIEIHYLNNAGTALIEILTLNGTTPVNSAAINIRFIQYINAHRVGTFGASATGRITAYKLATPTTVYSVISIGAGISLSSARMIPAGKSFYLNYIAVTGVSSKPLSIRLTATCDNGGTITPGIFLANEIFEIQDSTATVVVSVPRKFPEFSIIKGAAISNTAGGACSVSYGGWIE